MELPELVPLLEALLFSSDQPVTVQSLVKAVRSREVDGKAVREGLKELERVLDQGNRGVRLMRFGNGYQILTREEHASAIENLLVTRRKMRLSRAALETVAVIAYKEPISRLEVERIRGVDAGGVLATLLERGLIMIKGRDPGPGRPLLYGTTQSFLDYFGLTKLGDLPRLDELADLAGLDGRGWSEGERARFEKYGVDVTSVPSPENLDAEGDEDDEESVLDLDETLQAASEDEPDLIPEPASQEAEDRGSTATS